MIIDFINSIDLVYIKSNIAVNRKFHGYEFAVA